MCRGRGADCRFAFTPLLIKLEFMERLEFLGKRTRLLFAQGALLRAQVSSLSFQQFVVSEFWHSDAICGYLAQ
jgi:hypothetical protein